MVAIELTPQPSAVAFGLALQSGCHGPPFLIAGAATLPAALLFAFLEPVAA